MDNYYHIMYISFDGTEYQFCIVHLDAVVMRCDELMRDQTRLFHDPDWIVFPVCLERSGDADDLETLRLTGRGHACT